MSENDQPSDYKIELDAFAGPLDLLLYLIRRDEIDIYDIPVARITRQYMEYLDLIGDLNINVAGEFVVMAATLMEIKSRMMAPQPEAGEDEEEMEDPRMDLVRQLMAYKQFKEAAMDLKEREGERADRFARPGERPEGAARPSAPLPGDLTLWTLLEAFTRLMEQTGRRGPHRVVMDDVPQEVLLARLEQRARDVGQLTFLEVFEDQRSRAILLGMFLALLELVKRQVLRVEQEAAFGEIILSYVPEEERIVYEDEPPADSEGDVEPESVGEGLADQDDAWSEDDLDMDLPDIPDVEGDPSDAPPHAGEATEAPASSAAEGAPRTASEAEHLVPPPGG